MKRRPTPGVGTDPGPPIIVFPNPTAILIGRPIGIHLRSPNLAVRRVTHPLAAVVQIFGPVHILRDVVIAGGIQHLLVALFVPTVPFIKGDRGYNAEFRVVGVAPRQHGLSGLYLLCALWRHNLHIAQPHRDFRLTIALNIDAVNTDVGRPY